MTEKKMHYFLFHFQKFLAATKGWKDDEVGAFVKLLIEQFDRGYIPTDPAEIDRLITSRKKNWPILVKKFTAESEPGQLRNSFMIIVREDAQALSAINSANGKKGAEKRKKKISDRTATGQPIGERSDKRGLSYSVDSNQEPVSNSLKEKVAVLPERQQRLFEMFRRSAAEHITGEELLTEIGKFENKYSHLHINQCGPVINTWVANIGRIEAERAEAAANPLKIMVH